MDRVVPLKLLPSAPDLLPGIPGTSTFQGWKDNANQGEKLAGILGGGGNRYSPVWSDFFCVFACFLANIWQKKKKQVVISMFMS